LDSFFGMTRQPANHTDRRTFLKNAKSVALQLLVVDALAGCESSTSDHNPLREHWNLKRGPYVQRGTTDSILVVWQTFEAIRGAVEFGLTEELGTRVESSVEASSFALSLTGLSPDTYYYYRIFEDDRPVSELLRLHTNAGPESDELRFLVFGDSGTGTADMLDVADLVNFSAASFGLHTGDVVYFLGAEALYDPRFFYPYAPFLASNVLYPSLGNHDLHTLRGAPYLNNFFVPPNQIQRTERYYSFDYAHAHFVALDTNMSLAAGSTQLGWLEQDLAANTQPWTFVFFHYPPYSAGILDRDGRRARLEFPPLRRHLVPLLEQHGVDVVFSGHSHSYERTYPILQNSPIDRGQDPSYTDPGGPIYIITGGGGGNLTELDSSSLNAEAIAVPHLVEVSISGNELVGQAIAPPGEIIDEFRLVRT
jgi:hypothetical protein